MNDAQPSPTTSQQPDVDFALQSAGLGVWELDLTTNQIIWDERCRQLFGLAKDSQVSYEQAFQHIHPDDTARIEQAAQWAMDPLSDGVFDQIYRTIGADDSRLRWVRFWGKASFSTGRLVRYAGVAQDVTRQFLLEQNRQQVLTSFEQAPFAVAVLTGLELTYQMTNALYCQLVGRTADQLMGKPMVDAVPEVDEQGFVELLQSVIKTGVPYEARQTAFRVHPNEGNTAYFDFIYQPWLDVGQTTGVMIIAIDVTQQVLSSQQLHHIIEQTPAPTLVLRGEEYRIDQINAPMLAFMGRGEEVIGRPLLAIMPELAGQFAWQQVEQVYREGVDFEQSEVLVTHMRNGFLQDIYYNVSYRPLREGGQITGMIQVAIDVTEQVVARKQRAEVEARLRTIITNLPSATVVFRGRELIVEMPSQNFIDIINRGPDVEGKPLGELMPELESQSFLAILDEVYTSGRAFRAFGTPVNIRQSDGSTTSDFFDLIYTPVFDTEGQVYAILSVATNVTDIINAHRLLEESEERYRLLSEDLERQVQQRTEELAIQNKKLQASQQHLANFIRLAPVSMALLEGPDFVFTIANQEYFNLVGRTQEQLIGKSLLVAMPEAASTLKPLLVQLQQGTAVYANEVKTTIVRYGQPYTGYYNFIWEPYYSPDSALSGFVTVATEVTEQVSARQQAEESQTQYRRQSEQLAISNVDLGEANHLLARSNENLQQFAYVASHDLQEPLRKIIQFGDLLKSQHAEGLGDGLELLGRMQAAASRMSTLIRDLLAFSRITTRRDSEAPVSLSQVLDSVCQDLDLVISETGAQLTVERLPTVHGDQRQLEQLFQNLLSNALKFRQAGVVPLIAVRCQRIPADKLPLQVHPARVTRYYHQIDVVDNGIGFEQKYTDRIFQVFQRLHGKGTFAGTGIGLAICEKVAVNHGGAITATSQLGTGATFSVYLPVTYSFTPLI